MRQAIHHLVHQTRGKGFFDLTPAIRSWAEAQDLRTGLLSVFCRHTSASLLIQENADATVRQDLATFFERLAPEGARYAHDLEGPDDMPAHIRTALTQTSLSVPLDKGRLLLGIWQAIYLFEHRSSPHRRDLVLHLMGE